MGRIIWNCKAIPTKSKKVCQPCGTRRQPILDFNNRQDVRVTYVSKKSVPRKPWKPSVVKLEHCQDTDYNYLLFEQSPAVGHAPNDIDPKWADYDLGWCRHQSWSLYARSTRRCLCENFPKPLGSKSKRGRQQRRPVVSIVPERTASNLVTYIHTTPSSINDVPTPSSPPTRNDEDGYQPGSPTFDLDDCINDTGTSYDQITTDADGLIAELESNQHTELSDIYLVPLPTLVDDPSDDTTPPMHLPSFSPENNTPIGSYEDIVVENDPSLPAFALSSNEQKIKLEEPVYSLAATALDLVPIPSSSPALLLTTPTSTNLPHPSIDLLQQLSSNPVLLEYLLQTNSQHQLRPAAAGARDNYCVDCGRPRQSNWCGQCGRPFHS
jgi:hypothetical protein